MPRPRKDPADQRLKLLQFKVTEAEQAEIRDAAYFDRRTVSDWLRNLALDAARKPRKKPRGG